MQENKRNKGSLKAINTVNYESMICWEQLSYFENVFKGVILIIALILYLIEGVQIKRFVENDYYLAKQIAETTYSTEKSIKRDEFSTKITMDGRIKVIVENKGHILYDFSVEPIEIQVVNKNIIKIMIKNVLRAIVMYLLSTLVLELSTVSFIALKVKDEEERKKRNKILKEFTMEEKIRVYQKRGSLWKEIKYYLGFKKEENEKFSDEIRTEEETEA